MTTLETKPTSEERAATQTPRRPAPAVPPPRDLGGLQAQFPQLLQQPRRLRVHHPVRVGQLVRGLLARHLLHQQPGEPGSAQQVHAVLALALHPGDHDEHVGRRAAAGDRRAAADAAGPRPRRRAGQVPGGAGHLHGRPGLFARRTSSSSGCWARPISACSSPPISATG